jgi:hypothetical protein
VASNNISIIIQAQDKATATLKDVNRELGNTGSSAEKARSSSNRFGATLSKVGLIVGAAATAASATSAALGISFNSSVEQATARLNAFTKDGELTAEILEWVRKEAALTQFSFTDMANAAADLTPVAKSSGIALYDLIKEAEILAALNPAEGLTGAVFSLREALSGDWVSIIDRFNLPRTRINQLKDEGVPAMQIISQTLKEMGIDYDLVSKQGETAAARWDQIKDKFTMAFGRATEPLFQKISDGLDSLNDVDFDVLGENLAAGMQVGMDMVQNLQGALQVLLTGDYNADWFAGLSEDHWLVDWMTQLHDAAKKAWEFIQPAFVELGQVFNQHLVPAFEEFWAAAGPQVIEVLKATALVLGGLLIGALYLAVKVLTGLTWAITGVMKAFVWLDETIRGFITTVVTMAFNAGAAIGAFFSNLPRNIGIAIGQIIQTITRFVSSDVPNFVSGVVMWFQQLPQRIGKSLSDMWASAMSTVSGFGNSLVNWASGVVNSIVSFFQTLPQRIMAALSGASGGISGWLGEFTKGINIGIDRRSIGTNYASGGMTLVGEHGPEIINLPAGSQVNTAWQSRQSSTGTGGGHTVVIQNYNSYNERDDNRFFRDIGFALELAA